MAWPWHCPDGGEHHDTNRTGQRPSIVLPSIEKKYGKPISEWQALVRERYPAKHMEIVAYLKDTHGLGHGHANAIVAHTLAEDKA